MANAWGAFYWGDYIADTGHLTLAEHGAYLLLMAHYYRTRRPIPANASVLHRICRCTTDADRVATEQVVREFFVLDGNVYRHHRIDRELSKASEISEVRRAAANARYRKNYAANAAVNAVQVHTQPQPQPQPQNTNTSCAIAQSDGFHDVVLSIYEAYPRHVGKKTALSAIRRAIAEYAKEKNCLSKESADFIYSQVVKFAASPAGQRGTYTPYPATWMNAGRYADDPTQWLLIDTDKGKNGKRPPVEHLTRAEAAARLEKARVM